MPRQLSSPAAVAVVASLLWSAQAFAPPPPAATTSSLFRLNAAAAANGGNGVNFFAKLPWNVEKEREKQARKLLLERAKLHRELGIAEDSTYEEIVEVTDELISEAKDLGDIKQKIRIEVAKDRILQIRLNERLQGMSDGDAEARSISRLEQGSDEEVDDKNKKKEIKLTPKWTDGLVVRPDEKHLKRQVKIWSFVTLLGLVFPPAQDYLGRFTWLICVGQLTFRGMPQDAIERGSMMSLRAGGTKGSHRTLAFMLGFLTWIAASVLITLFIPSYAQGLRWSGSLQYSLKNVIFFLVCLYLQPYKG